MIDEASARREAERAEILKSNLRRAERTSSCSFCDRRLRKSGWGMDPLGRVYCRRRRCRLAIWWKKKKRGMWYRIQRTANQALVNQDE